MKIGIDSFLFDNKVHDGPKIFLKRLKDSIIKKSNYLKCLHRNNIKRDDKFFGEKLIYSLIKYYLHEKKY